MAIRNGEMPMNRVIKGLWSALPIAVMVGAASTNALATPIAVGLQTPGGGTTTTFDVGGWVVDTYGTSAGLNNDLGDGGFDSGQFLRTGGIGSDTLTVDLAALPTHTGFSIGLHVAQLDSLDPERDGDMFYILVNGVEVLQVGLGFGTELGFSEPLVWDYEVNGVDSDESDVAAVSTATGNLFGSSWTEHVYDFGALSALQNIAHTDSSLQIQIRAGTNQGWSNEAYAIDNLSITLHNSGDVPEPATALLASLGLIGTAVVRRRKRVMTTMRP